jgi:hypothetical protein
LGAQADLEFAVKSEADTVESSAFGARATYPVEEFRVLVERQVAALGQEQNDALARVKKHHTNISNLLDEIEDIESLLAVEAGPLMQRAVQKQHLIRCMCANASNLMANDVTGKASGGVKLVAVGVENYAAVYDIETGALMQVSLTICIYIYVSFHLLFSFVRVYINIYIKKKKKKAITL